MTILVGSSYLSLLQRGRHYLADNGPVTNLNKKHFWGGLLIKRLHCFPSAAQIRLQGHRILNFLYKNFAHRFLVNSGDGNKSCGAYIFQRGQGIRSLDG